MNKGLETNPVWLIGRPEGWYVHLWIHSGATVIRMDGIREGRLKLHVHAQPIDGHANRAILDAIARVLKCPRAAVELVSGLMSKQKTVRIARGQLDQTTLLAALVQLGPLG